MSARARWLVFALAFAAAGLCVMGALAGVTRALGLQPGPNALAVVRTMEVQLAAMQRARAEQGALAVAWLGDSTVVSRGGTSLPQQLQTLLDDELASPVHVASLASPGMTLVAYGHLIGPVVEARPDVVVWQVSFTHFEDAQTLARQHRRLAGWIGCAALPDALRMPIWRIGLTADQILFYGAIVHAGLFEGWYRLVDEQSRVSALRRAAERAVAARTGAHPERRFSRSRGIRKGAAQFEQVDGRPRYGTAREVNHYGDALRGLGPEQYVVAALSRALRRLTAAGIGVIVYLNPVNLDNVERLGLLDAEAVSRSVAVLRGEVESTGARWIDLHAAYGDEWFTDAAGHFRQGHPDGPPQRIVRLVADGLIADHGAARR